MAGKQVTDFEQQWSFIVILNLWFGQGGRHVSSLSPEASDRESQRRDDLPTYSVIMEESERVFWLTVFLPPLGPPITGSSLPPVIQIFQCLELSPSPFLISIYSQSLVISSSLVELLPICKIFLIYICSLDHSFESQIHTSTILPKLYLNISNCFNLPLLKPGF